MSELTFDLADCLARARLRDQDAAKSLVEYLAPFVTNIVRRKLPRGAAEEDLVQEIFSKMFQKLDQYRGEVPLNHWVSKIAVNHSLNAIRWRAARPEWRMADLPEDQEAALESNFTDHEQSEPGDAMASRELVERMLETLNPRDRSLIRMLDIEGLSPAEVRSLTGFSEAYIRLRAFRARRKLNKLFRQTEDDCPGTKAKNSKPSGETDSIFYARSRPMQRTFS